MNRARAVDTELFADLLDTARRTRVTLHPFAARLGIGTAEAYAIQKAGLARRLARGEKIVGFKLGFTSEAMRRQMGIHSANFGFLTDATMFEAGGTLDTARLIHPRAEPEVAVRLARDLRWPVDRAGIADAVAASAAAIEIVDSRFHDYGFTLEDNVADNSSAAAFVLGAWRDRALEPGGARVALTIDDKLVEEGTTTAAMGHPLDALVEAARLAHDHGYALDAGAVILTGGLTAAPYVKAGQSVRARIMGLGEVGFAVV